MSCRPSRSTCSARRRKVCASERMVIGFRSTMLRSVSMARRNAASAAACFRRRAWFSAMATQGRAQPGRSVAACSRRAMPAFTTPKASRSCPKR